MRILIADDQALVRDALRTLLKARGHQVVEADCGSQAVDLARQCQPDVILLDLGCPTSEVTATARHLSTHLPSAAVIVLTEHEEEEVLFKAIRAGAKGYLTKDLDGDDFCDLIEGAGRGEPALSPGIASMLLAAFAKMSRDSERSRGPMNLTAREQDVLDHMTRGVTSNRALATVLRVSENTVRFHVRNILEKLHLHSRAAAVAYALTHGIVEGDHHGDG